MVFLDRIKVSSSSSIKSLNKNTKLMPAKYEIIHFSHKSTYQSFEISSVTVGGIVVVIVVVIVIIVVIVLQNVNKRLEKCKQTFGKM